MRRRLTLASLLGLLLGLGFYGLPAWAQSIFVGRLPTNCTAAQIPVSAGTNLWTCGSGGSAAAAGLDTEVQFNDGGVFGADAGMTYVKASDIMTLVGGLDLLTTGVRASGADGVLTLLGLGNGADENLTIDLDNAGANTIALASGTGASLLTWTGQFNAANLLDAALTATRVTFAGTGGLLDDDDSFLYDDSIDALTGGLRFGAGPGVDFSAMNRDANGDIQLFQGRTITVDSGYIIGFDVQAGFITGAAIPGTTLNPIFMQSDSTVGHTTDGLISHDNTMRITMANAVTLAYANGFETDMFLAGSGTITDLTGYYSSVNFEGVTITNFQQYSARMPTLTMGATLGNYYGLYGYDLTSLTVSGVKQFINYADKFIVDSAGDVSLQIAGVKQSAADGVLTLLGLGNGNDENWTIDFDNAAANTIAWASGTGANNITWTGAFTPATLTATTLNNSAIASLGTAHPTITVDGATTFAATSTYLVLACTGTETINTITGGSAGTILVIDNTDTDCTLASDADPTAANAMALLASDVGAVNKTIVLIHNGSYWLELSESDNQ